MNTAFTVEQLISLARTGSILVSDNKDLLKLWNGILPGRFALSDDSIFRYLG